MATQPIRTAGTNPSATITIQQGGTPNQQNTTIQAGQQVAFYNSTSTDYLIQLWTHGNDHQVQICLYLTAGSTVTFQAQPGLANGRCNYAVLTTSGQWTKITQGGSNSVIIGSGNTE